MTLMWIYFLCSIPVFLIIMACMIVGKRSDEEEYEDDGS